MSDSTAIAVVRDIAATLRAPAMQQQIKNSLPPSVSVDRFTATTITAVNHNPGLLTADRQSLYNAVVKAAQDGLLPDGNDAVLNIYNTKVGDKYVKKVQYQRMVGGIIKQFAKAGIQVFANSVYQEDQFSYYLDDDGQHIKHVPVQFGKPKGERIGAYAVAKLATGAVVIQTMDNEELQRARDASKSGDSGPWKAWPERMEQKSCLHRLRKRVAVLDEQAASELNRLDDEFEDGEETTPAATPPAQEVPTQASRRPAALQAVVDQSTPPAEDGAIVIDGDPGPQEGDII